MRKNEPIYQVKTPAQIVTVIIVWFFCTLLCLFGGVLMAKTPFNLGEDLAAIMPLNSGQSYKIHEQAKMITPTHKGWSYQLNQHLMLNATVQQNQYGSSPSFLSLQVNYPFD